jgi:hypothetical protein
VVAAISWRADNPLAGAAIRLAAGNVGDAATNGGGARR